MILQHTSFAPACGVKEDFFSAVTARPYENFSAEAAALLTAYDQALQQYQCSPDSEVFLKLHLSDIANQYPILTGLLQGRKSFISIVGQPPAGFNRIALEAWHWSNTDKKICSDNLLECNTGNHRFLWHSCQRLQSKGSFDQTYESFVDLQQELTSYNANVKDHTIRTWLYCRDVDNNYIGLVKGRNRFFAENGLTSATHFIASTGIEGQAGQVDWLVKMDSVSSPELKEENWQYLHAFDMLSPTTLYGVSFERGTRLIFGDRSHFYISGTASIDHRGEVLYPGDVAAQTARMLDNIEALLQEGAGALSDIKQGTLYLRDTVDAPTVEKIIRRRLPDIALVTLKAPVCRPAWLVEMECIAVNAVGNASLTAL